MGGGGGGGGGGGAPYHNLPPGARDPRAATALNLGTASPYASMLEANMHMMKGKTIEIAVTTANAARTCLYEIRFLPYLITKNCVSVISAIWVRVNTEKKIVIPTLAVREGDEQLPNRGRSAIIDISRSRPYVEGATIHVIVTPHSKIVIGSLIFLSAWTWYRIVAPINIVGTMTSSIWATDIAT